jgi:hypothetical protein
VAKLSIAEILPQFVVRERTEDDRSNPLLSH